MRNKKGLSAIVATLIIILLAIVAFGIVSVVVRNTVTKGAESIELGDKCLEAQMHIDKVSNYSFNEYRVTLSRAEGGSFPVDGVALIFIDAAGENSIRKQVIKENIQPQSKFTENVTINPNELDSVATIQVVPFFMTKAGKIHNCVVTDTFDLE